MIEHYSAFQMSKIDPDLLALHVASKIFKHARRIFGTKQEMQLARNCYYGYQQTMTSWSVACHNLSITMKVPSHINVLQPGTNRRVAKVICLGRGFNRAHAQASFFTHVFRMVKHFYPTEIPDWDRKLWTAWHGEEDAMNQFELGPALVAQDYQSNRQKPLIVECPELMVPRPVVAEEVMELITGGIRALHKMKEEKEKRRAGKGRPFVARRDGAGSSGASSGDDDDDDDLMKDED